MNILRTSLALLSLAALFALGGCFNANPDESTIPHAQPADWENQGPGGFGGGRY